MANIIPWIINNWKVVGVGIIGLVWAYSLWYVDDKRYHERNAHWEEKIRNAPVKVDTVYEDVPVYIKPVSDGKVETEAIRKAILDSLEREAGRSTNKYKEILAEVVEPFTNEYYGELAVQAEDTNLSVNIPYYLTVTAYPLSDTTHYNLNPGSIKLPTRVIIKEKQILVELSTWDYVQYYGTGVAIGIAGTLTYFWVTGEL